MDTLNEVLNVSSFAKASVVIFVCSIIYSVVHMTYDITTKSDIEKCLTYRGKDRILSSFFMYIVIVLMTIVLTFEELITISKEGRVFLSVILILSVSMVLFLVTLCILVILHIVLTWTKAYPTYEVKIDDSKDEYWRIYKVTKNNSVILKRKDNYLLLSNVKELDKKIIKKQARREV